MTRADTFIIPSALIALFLLYAVPATAAMTEVSDEALSSVSAQAGININYGDFGVNLTWDSIRYSDTDSDPKQWVEFNNVEISGRDGEHYFYLDCPEEYPMTIDVANATTIDGQSRTMIALQISDHVNPRTMTVEEFVFAGQELGEIEIDNITMDPSSLLISSHQGPGTQGIDYEFLTKIHVDEFKYTYQTNPGPGGTRLSFDLADITLAGQATGAPEDPSTWGFSGQFRVGDILGGQIDFDNDPLNQAYPNPATFDVATDTTTNTTAAYINVPLQGSIRMGAVNIGTAGFGPVAIDGITSHYLCVRFSPGN